MLHDYEGNEYTGRILSLREENRYHDSYFHALVWDDKRNEPRDIEYGGTHCCGWTHPAVDATPETLAKYEAYRAAQRASYQRMLDVSTAATPTLGKAVRVVKGRKVPIGSEGVIFWYGEAREYGSFPRGGHKEASRSNRAMLNLAIPPASGIKEGYRVGILIDGVRVFTAATNVEVIA